jgi:hypothetical protein
VTVPSSTPPAPRGPGRPRVPKPLCACGCRREVRDRRFKYLGAHRPNRASRKPWAKRPKCPVCNKHLKNRNSTWHRRCVPAEIYAESQRARSLARRLERYRAYLDELTANGGIKRSALLDVFARVELEGYVRGKNFTNNHWRRRLAEAGIAIPPAIRDREELRATA